MIVQGLPNLARSNQLKAWCPERVLCGRPSTPRRSYRAGATSCPSTRALVQLCMCSLCSTYGPWLSRSGALQVIEHWMPSGSRLRLWCQRRVYVGTRSDDPHAPLAIRTRSTGQRSICVALVWLQSICRQSAAPCRLGVRLQIVGLRTMWGLVLHLQCMWSGSKLFAFNCTQLHFTALNCTSLHSSALRLWLRMLRELVLHLRCRRSGSKLFAFNCTQLHFTALDCTQLHLSALRLWLRMMRGLALHLQYLWSGAKL